MERHCKVHDNGPVFHGLAQSRFVFTDTESVHSTRDTVGQVLGQFFDTTLGPCPRSFETLQDAHDFQTSYGMPPVGVRTGPAITYIRDEKTGHEDVSRYS